MNAVTESEKAVKKSLSFPPSLWAFVLDYAGDTGNPSRVVQKAVRLLKETQEKSSEKSKNGMKGGINEVSEAAKKVSRNKK
jgi:hypothetical protein